ncbi:MAG: hypothetical protein JST82_03335 [Bacteroidetes bacterium]|nr:hypothetical protein [Bacteroidota bacterium]
MLKVLAVLIIMLGKGIAVNAQQPSSCDIEGKILSIIKECPKDKQRLCAKHPCMAKVKVLQLSNCGSGMTDVTGDTIVLHFTYTLDNTKKIFPQMKIVYPGLKKGNVFTGRVEQRVLPGNKVEWVINDYHLK